MKTSCKWRRDGKKRSEMMAHLANLVTKKNDNPNIHSYLVREWAHHTKPQILRFFITREIKVEYVQR